MDAADRVLQVYASFLHYYPLNFTFVRDILAYFYGHLPGKLIIRILNVLGKKVIMINDPLLPFLACFAIIYVIVLIALSFRFHFLIHFFNILTQLMLRCALHWITLLRFYWVW